MEIFGYIIISINTIVAVLLSFFVNIDKLFEEAREQINKEAIFVFKQFGNTRSNDIYGVEDISKQLNKFLLQSHNDLHKIDKKEGEFNLHKTISILVVLVAVGFVIIGHFCPDTPKFWSYRNQFIIIVPFIILVYEVIVLLIMESTKKYLNKVKSNYKN